jgi:hypothetical protein
MSGAHGAVEGSNKSVALLISVLALFLAFGETLAKSAQTNAISDNVEASNLWAFFQAKTVRQTVVRTAIEQADGPHVASADAAPDATTKRVDTWNKTVARWESEPETGEGRKELASRAKEAEHRRDLSLARYHHYELGSAAFQIGIVLSSAMVITGIAALAWAGAALGVAGVAMLLIGLLAPHAVHLF